MLDHAEDHRELEQTVPGQMVAQWKVEVEAWEQDATKPNPFEAKVEGMGIRTE